MLPDDRLTAKRDLQQWVAQLEHTAGLPATSQAAKAQAYAYAKRLTDIALLIDTLEAEVASAQGALLGAVPVSSIDPLTVSYAIDDAVVSNMGAGDSINQIIIPAFTRYIMAELEKDFYRLGYLSGNRVSGASATGLRYSIGFVSPAYLPPGARLPRITDISELRKFLTPAAKR